MQKKLRVAMVLVLGLIGASWCQLDTASNVSGVTAGAIYNPGQVRALSWVVLVPHPGNIVISFSVNGSVWTPVVTLPANSTTYNWTVPATVTFHGLIRVYQLRTDTNPAPPATNGTTPYSLRSAQFNIAYPVSVWGSVTNSVGGAPISGATVVLVTPAGAGGPGRRVDSAVTNAGGSYTMAPNVLAGAGYTLIVSAPGFTTITRNNVTIDVNPNLNGQNFALVAGIVSLNPPSGYSHSPRIHGVGNRRVVEFGYSPNSRPAEFYDLKGALIRVPLIIRKPE